MARSAEARLSTTNRATIVEIHTNLRSIELPYWIIIMLLGNLTLAITSDAEDTAAPTDCVRMD
jgi:hypothetical protein